MPQHFEGSETHPTAPTVMGRFADLAKVGPQTLPKDVFLAFHTAGNVVTFLLERGAGMDRETATDFMHGMARMYMILFEKYLGFEASDEEVEQINCDAHRQRTDLEDQLGEFATYPELTNAYFERYLKTLHPGVDQRDLNVRLYAFVDIAVDGVEETPNPVEYLELVSSGFLYGSSQLLGITPLSLEAHTLRQEAIPPAAAFLKDN